MQSGKVLILIYFSKVLPEIVCLTFSQRGDILLREPSNMDTWSLDWEVLLIKFHRHHQILIVTGVLFWFIYQRWIMSLKLLIVWIYLAGNVDNHSSKSWEFILQQRTWWLSLGMTGFGQDLLQLVILLLVSIVVYIRRQETISVEQILLLILNINGMKNNKFLMINSPLLKNLVQLHVVMIF